MSAPRIRCPICGGSLYIEMGWRGSGHLSYEAPDGYSCNQCYATWDVDGELETGPNEYVRPVP